MIAACRKCGKLVEMTTEEVYTPAWCCTGPDRLCVDCWKEPSRLERSGVVETTLPKRLG